MKARPLARPVRVLLLWPGPDAGAEGNFGVPQLVLLATYARARTRATIDIRDLECERGLGPVSLPALLAGDEGLGYDVVALSAYSSFDHLKCTAIAEIARALWPEAVIVVGGYHPSARPLDYMQIEGREVLPRLLEASGIEDAVLVGHSDGGSIALVYAGSEPKIRVRGLALLGLTAGEAIVVELSDDRIEKISLDSVAYQPEAADRRDRLHRQAASETGSAVVSLASRRKIAPAHRIEEPIDPNDDDPGPNAA